MQHFYRTIHGYPNNLPYAYTKAVKLFSTGAHFVEVGAFKGASAAAMIVEIANSQKQIKFDVVDKWESSNIFCEFKQNLKHVQEYFTAIRLSSIEAAKLYADLSLDLVCIDAAHDYENVITDITAWLPKIKPGGVLLGDDYNENHPGVIKAVDELLPQRKLLGITWWYDKI